MAPVDEGGDRRPTLSATSGGAITTAARRLTSGRRWLAIAVALSVVPVVRMIWWVRQGSVVQYADYWESIDGLIRPDGGLVVRDLARFQGAQLLTVPQVIYWLNARLFGGSNITLGYLVVILALAQVAVVWWWIGRSTRVGGVLRAALAAASAAMVFAPHGAWSFLLSMSGTAWLLSNLLALAAITLVVRDRRWGAVGLAVVATATYGTGLLVWPALVVASVLRHRRLRPAWPLVVVGVPVLAGYQILRRSAGMFAAPSIGHLLSDMATLVGGLFLQDPSTARILGAVAIVATVALATAGVWLRLQDATPWAALAVYAIGSAALIGYSRDGVYRLFGGEEGFLSSRYGSVAALLWISLLGLAAVVIGPRRPPLLKAVAALVIGIVGVSAALGDVGTVRAIQQSKPLQQQLGDALRVGVAEGGPWLVFEPFPDVTPLLSSIGHYPFDGRYHGACGLLGTTVDDDDRAVPSDGVAAGRPRAHAHDQMTSAVIIGAWVRRPGWDFDCAAVADQTGRVVGVGRDDGFVSPGAPPDTIGIRAIAPDTADSYTLLVKFHQSDQLFALPPAPAPPR